MNPMVKVQLYGLVAMLIEALAVMDDCGRSNDEGNSMMLWEGQWNDVRNRLYLILKILKEMRGE